MPLVLEDNVVSDHAQPVDLGQLEGTAVGIDAGYYLQFFLDTTPFHEPLLPALGGLTGIGTHVEADLEKWQGRSIKPFFIFDGQPVAGQDALSVRRAKQANAKTSEAWRLYFASQATSAVTAFGENRHAYPVQNLFPMLQAILKKRKLHFLVPPTSAAAQLAYLDMIDSDQISAIMGSQELFLYPIKDYVVRSVDWDNGTFRVLSKRNLLKSFNVGESMFLDAQLMVGTTFLPTFPPLLDSAIIPQQPPNVGDAINLLRTSEKSVVHACNSFNDVCKRQDPDWLNKYRKARMTIEHFIYIAESGEVKCHNYDTLTKDNYEYLGYKLPEELLHYLNRGLISARVPSYVTHGQILVRPTLDGEATEEYRKLVTTDLMPLREHALNVLYPRLHRGLSYKKVEVKVWFDDSYTHKLEYRIANNTASKQAHSWYIKDVNFQKLFPDANHGSVLFELQALKNGAFLEAVAKDAVEVDEILAAIAKGKEEAAKNSGKEATGATEEKKERIRVEVMNDPGLIISVTIWRFLQIRGYVDDQHKLTAWGEALKTSLEALAPVIAENPKDNLSDAVLLAYELLRFGLLNARNQHPELNGLPMNGTESDKNCLLLVSRCAILVKLHHESNGYTGPLSKNFLNSRSLSSAIREADRDLIESIIASLLLHGQAKREQSDLLAISHKLPFLSDTDVGLGIAVKTLLDEINLQDPTDVTQRKRSDFPSRYVPFATNFFKDLEIAFKFFDALEVGIRSLPKEQVSDEDRQAFADAKVYLDARR